MRACHNCLHWDVCSVREDDIACGIYKPKEKRNVKPQTNADRIRAMSEEELAEQLIQYRDDWGDYCTHKGCYATQKEAVKSETEWLQQPAE